MVDDYMDPALAGHFGRQSITVARSTQPARVEMYVISPTIFSPGVSGEVAVHEVGLKHHGKRGITGNPAGFTATPP